MSRSLIARSDDLRRLREEGYDVSVVSSHLAMKGVPYVTPERDVAYGMLVSELTIAGDRTIKPSTHVVFFTGTTPCDQHGEPIPGLVNDPTERDLAGFHVRCSFSQKPKEGYPNYHAKMTTFPPIEPDDDDPLPSATSTPRPAGRASVRPSRGCPESRSPSSDSGVLVHTFSTSSPRRPLGRSICTTVTRSSLTTRSARQVPPRLSRFAKRRPRRTTGRGSTTPCTRG